MLGILDIDGVRMFFATGSVRVVLLAVLIGVGAYLLLSTDLLLGLLALSFVPFVAWRSSVIAAQAARHLARAAGAAADALAGDGREPRRHPRRPRLRRPAPRARKFDRRRKNALDLAHERTRLRVNNSAAMNFSFFAAMGLVLWFGGQKVIAGEITVGTLAEFLTFMTILQMPVRQLGLMVNSFARASTCGKRLFDLLDLPLDVDDKPGAKPLAITEGTLQVRQRQLRLPGGARPQGPDEHQLHRQARRDHRHRRPAGQRQVDDRAPDPALLRRRPAAPITIDGQDIRDVTLESLRKAVAVVQQDPFLFTTTIENNIAYGDPWAREQRIERAAEYAQLANYIVGLPHSYDTVVGERGVSLSGGQRQRMTIARTLVLRPAVLVFDDSTAAIDAGTEQRIRTAMKRYAKDRVTIIIAHRLSSLMHADHILFIDDGRDRRARHPRRAAGARRPLPRALRPAGAP